MISREEKLRAIGARLVETCTSCRHRGIDAPRCRRHGITLPDDAVCNDYNQHISTRLGRAGSGLDRVGTPTRRWVDCTCCSWEGWSLECLDDGYDTWDRCPQCGERVETGADA